MNTLSPSAIVIQKNGAIPNNPRLPVLVYRKVFDTNTANKPKKFQQCFEKNGWKGIWKNGLYDYCHFHSSSHEVLAIANGNAEVELGGENGKILSLEEGDLIVLPAGTGHKRVSASDNLVVIGAYPEGQENYDICRHRTDGADDIDARIAAVSLPSSDPVYGVSGPLLRYWTN